LIHDVFFSFREQRSANTLYQELSFQDAEALGEMDDGADITGELQLRPNLCRIFAYLRSGKISNLPKIGCALSFV